MIPVSQTQGFLDRGYVESPYAGEEIRAPNLQSEFQLLIFNSFGDPPEFFVRFKFTVYGASFEPLYLWRGSTEASGLLMQTPMAVPVVYDTVEVSFIPDPVDGAGTFDDNLVINGVGGPTRVFSLNRSLTLCLYIEAPYADDVGFTVIHLDPAWFTGEIIFNYTDQDVSFTFEDDILQSSGIIPPHTQDDFTFVDISTCSSGYTYPDPTAPISYNNGVGDAFLFDVITTISGETIEYAGIHEPQNLGIRVFYLRENSEGDPEPTFFVSGIPDIMAPKTDEQVGFFPDTSARSIWRSEYFNPWINTL